MSNTNSTSASSGVGLSTVLGAIFITLKLVHVIAWPWVWVLSPLWIPWAIVLVILLVLGIVAGVAAVLK